MPKTRHKLEINTDFRVGILFELLMQNTKIPDDKKVKQALTLYYGNQTIQNEKQAVEDLIWFYSCGREQNTNKSKGGGDGASIYSYEYDDVYIFSAFLSEYNIDLNDIDLHWWKFKALFNSLSENCLFSKIMGYRSVELSNIKDENQKAFYRKMKLQYALPDNRTEKEKEEAFGDALW